MQIRPESEGPERLVIESGRLVPQTCAVVQGPRLRAFLIDGAAEDVCPRNSLSSAVGKYLARRAVQQRRSFASVRIFAQRRSGRPSLPSPRESITNPR